MKRKVLFTKHLHIILSPAEHTILRKISFKTHMSIGSIIRTYIDDLIAGAKAKL